MVLSRQLSLLSTQNKISPAEPVNLKSNWPHIGGVFPFFNDGEKLNENVLALARLKENLNLDIDYLMFTN